MKETIAVKLKIDMELYKQLREIAEKEERTIASLIRIGIKKLLKEFDVNVEESNG